MHGGGRMTTDPRIPTMPGGARRVFTTRQAPLAPSAKRREVLGESHEGRAASLLHRTSGEISCTWMAASNEFEGVAVVVRRAAGVERGMIRRKQPLLECVLAALRYGIVISFLQRSR